jgi:hypothetical protein
MDLLERAVPQRGEAKLLPFHSIKTSIGSSPRCGLITDTLAHAASSTRG